MKKLITLIFSGVLLAISLPAVAQIQKVTVYLKSMNVLKTTERGGDELYFHVTEYRDHKSIRTYTVPTLPSHWTSKYLNNVKNVLLWQGFIEKKEKVTIDFSLAEHDAPPLDPDDLIGTAALKLKENNGRVVATWLVKSETKHEITRKDTEQTAQKTFKLLGNGGEYEIVMKMETK